MSKFSNLLIISTALFLVSCATSKPRNTNTFATEESEEVAKQEAASDIVVDKENNSIKVGGKNKKLKPMFDWPVWEARLTRGFLPQGTRRSRRPHKGIDLAAPRGSAVMASQSGVVIYTGSAFRGYGKMVMIESTDPRDGSNWATLYGHLDKILVYEGKTVKQHEVIGALGNTGRSSGPHLHFEIRRLNGPIDPLPMLPAGEALSNDVDNGSTEE